VNIIIQTDNQDDIIESTVSWKISKLK